MIGDHWEKEIRRKCNLDKDIDTLDSVVRLYVIKTALTDGCKYIGETEVIHSIKGQEVVEKLLLLIITTKESISLVKFSKGKRRVVRGMCENTC